jgi:small subunit ribosomal protein S16
MDSKVARDGKVITEIGIYNPLTEPATVEIDEEQAIKYLQSGARPTQTVRALLRQKGILEKIHKAKQQAKQAK